MGRRIALVLTAMLMLAAPASGAVTKSSYKVPVSDGVEIDTDVYVPGAPAPRPLVVVFHGGGSNKGNEFDAGHARKLAEHGYTSLIYSQRGHGDSGGQTAVAGPVEMRDAYDVIAWAAGRRAGPAHPAFGIDAGRIALLGDSQGGLHTNLVQVHAGGNSYGLSFKVLAPGNTPDSVFQALVPNNVVKLSLGAGLIATYVQGTQGKISPVVEKWIATTVADQPGSYGPPENCPVGEHDTLTSPMKTDLAARSVGCHAERVTPPFIWAQAFDDTVFPPEMAIDMWRRRGGAPNALYLSMAGHGAPGYDARVDADRFGAQVEYIDHVLLGSPLRSPPVVYWSRDPDVRLKEGEYRWPYSSWVRKESQSWPPPNVTSGRYQLGAGGKLVRGGAAEGTLPLGPPPAEPGNDPVLQSLASGRIPGLSAGSASPSGSPGAVAGFSTEPFAEEKELSGAPVAQLAWTPAGAESQVVVKVFDRAPDGTLTLLSRGVDGMRGGTPGQRRTVTVTTNDFSALIHRGHSLVAWVSAGDASFYKAYPASAGGVLQAGGASTLELPLGVPRPVVPPPARGGPAAGSRGLRLRARVSPRRARAGKRTRFRFRVTAAGRPVRGATVRFARRRTRTRKNGRARITVRLRRRGTYRVRVTQAGMRPATVRVRALRRRAR